MIDAPTPIAGRPERTDRRTLTTVGAFLAIALLWVAFFWRLLVAPGPDRLMLVRSPAVLAAQAAREASLEYRLTAGDLCAVGPEQRTLVYPPALAAVAAHAAAGNRSYPFRSLEWEVMLHALVAAVGAGAWLTARPAGAAAAVAGATAYAFGALGAGFALPRPDTLAAMAWLPWGLWSARRAVGSTALGWPLGAAACGALAVLSGDYTVGLAAAAMIGGALWLARPRDTLSHVAAAALFAAVASPALLAGPSSAQPWPVSRGWASVVPGAAVLFLGSLSLRTRWAFGAGVAAAVATLALDAVHTADGALPALALAAHAALASAAAGGVHATASAAGFRLRHRIARAALAGAFAAALAFAAVVAAAVLIRLDIPPVAGLDAEANRLALMALSLAACAVLARWRAASPRTPHGWTALAAGVVVFETLSSQHFGGMDAVADVAATTIPALACRSALSAAWLIAVAATGLAAVAMLRSRTSRGSSTA